MKKVGGISGMLALLPGISKTQKSMAENNVTDDMLIKQLAIIDSMTPKERSNPEIIKASRKIRISNGSGTKVQEVNRLLKQFVQSQKMIKRMSGLKKSEGTYLNGKKEGNWIYWHEVFGPHIIESKGYYKLGYRDGLWEYWYPNGEKREIGNLTNQERVGKWTYYNEDGSLDIAISH